MRARVDSMRNLIDSGALKWKRRCWLKMIEIDLMPWHAPNADARNGKTPGFGSERRIQISFCVCGWCVLLMRRRRTFCFYYGES
jgi:hypothetical protein